MILLLGSATDWCVRDLLSFLHDQGRPVAFAPEADFGATPGLSWTLSGTASDGFVQVEDTRVALQELRGVFARLPGTSRNLDLLTADDRNYLESECGAVRLGWLHALRCPVINRPRPGLATIPTFYGSVAAALLGSGLALPPHVTTANTNTARAFLARHGGRAWVWQPGQVRPVLAEDVPAGPSCLQAVPEGEWVRVFLAGREVAATAVAESELRPGGVAPAVWPTVALPERLRERCRRLGEALDLGFCELLLVTGGDGRDYCLSINSHPCHEGCEPAARAAITAGLAEVLVNEHHHRRAA